jgi:Heparinase II/III-like protein
VSKLRTPRLGWYLRRLAGMSPAESRPSGRPPRPADVGVTLLRTAGNNSPEICCRCDGGPHGYQGIAAHDHADALSVEIRYAGVDILADPCTCCDRSERVWRSYFRFTIAPNSAGTSRRSQSMAGAPSVWRRHVRAREIEVIDDGDIARWTAEHDGYAALDPPALHRRSVLLDRASRSIDIIDVIDGRHNVRLAFHLGPDVQAELDESGAVLNWPTAPAPGSARLDLPPGLRWSLHRGDAEPSRGWYGTDPGRREPACTLLGRGRCWPGMPLITRLEFLDVGKSAKSAVSRQAISWITSVTRPTEAPEIRAEAR